MSENVPLDTLLEHLHELNVHFCGDFEETSKLTGDTDNLCKLQGLQHCPIQVSV